MAYIPDNDPVFEEADTKLIAEASVKELMTALAKRADNFICYFGKAGNEGGHPSYTFYDAHRGDPTYLLGAIDIMRTNVYATYTARRAEAEGAE